MKRFCIILALVLVFLFLISCTPAAEPSIGGDPLSRDEVPQEEIPAEPEGFTVRTDVTIESITYNTLGRGEFKVILTNHTEDTVASEVRCYFQKKVEDDWFFVPFSRTEYYSEYIGLAAGATGEKTLYGVPYGNVPGEFRVLFGKEGNIRVVESANGELSLAFEKGAELIVGHITVTEAPQFGPLVEKDGLLQNELITMTDVYYADGQVHYTLTNCSDFRVYLANLPRVEKKINGEWESVSLYEMFSYWDLGELSKHTTRTETITIKDDLNMELQGEYRLLCGRDKCGANTLLSDVTDEFFYIIGYLTIE